VTVNIAPGYYGNGWRWVCVVPRCLACTRGLVTHAGYLRYRLRVQFVIPAWFFTVPLPVVILPLPGYAGSPPLLVHPLPPAFAFTLPLFGGTVSSCGLVHAIAAVLLPRLSCGSGWFLLFGLVLTRCFTFAVNVVGLPPPCLPAPCVHSVAFVTLFLFPVLPPRAFSGPTFAEHYYTTRHRLDSSILARPAGLYFHWFNHQARLVERFVRLYGEHGSVLPHLPLVHVPRFGSVCADLGATVGLVLRAFGSLVCSDGLVLGFVGYMCYRCLTNGLDRCGPLRPTFTHAERCYQRGLLDAI
jgi:hypothetical protein